MGVEGGLADFSCLGVCCILHRYQAAYLMGENVNNLTQLLQGVEVYEAGAQGIVQDGGKGVHQGGEAGALWILSRKEVVKQLMLILTHLHYSSHVHQSLVHLLHPVSEALSTDQSCWLAEACKILLLLQRLSLGFICFVWAPCGVTSRAVCGFDSRQDAMAH